MTGVDYEREYDNRARVPEHPQIFARWATDSESYRARLRAQRQARISYGPTPREIIDLFDARADAPLAVFIHGGWWRNFEPSLFSHLAAGLNAHGIGVALPGYNLCPQVRIADIIKEMRRALLSLWHRYGRRVLVFGHSAGGHLTAAMLATNWPALDATAPADLVSAGYAISGVFDLAPLVHVSMNQDFRLDADGARKISPVLWPAPRGRVLDAVVGTYESNEFLRQSRIIVDAWGNGGAITRYEKIVGANHFTVLDALTDPNSAMVTRLLALMPKS
ncbi:MAG TPA: alpha/beta hydrolase [Xanthobacteraceae bacterium]|nr:alpha/beta hydrolase [Xanthobacteraceae bacterium]